MDFNQILDIVIPATLQTLYMVSVSSIIAVILGLPLGIILTITREDGISPSNYIYTFLSTVINVFRAIPFAILIIILLGLSRLIVGKIIGPTAFIVPLTIGSIPFVARIMESYFLDMDKGFIEAAKAMGSTNKQIIFKVMIPETIPMIINGVVMTIINIIGYSAMAGFIGGGGLGEIALRYGHQRREYTILWISVILMVLIVQIVQVIGNYLNKKTNKK
ncbi:methionine ABC transporter permease [Miniphocaeibacter massiliensis]|uniref:methionine ABC transporter permease n=1 Tax=Miniphocaeibacter massiliensis TaxID=2041841 RepID=UPI000C1BC8EF|nr:methionine ABC transporter permease [Miniphocaeibacter massiliensis]